MADNAVILVLDRSHPDLSALRWSTTIESTLANLTIFDRAQNLLAFDELRQLTARDPEVLKAAALLGLA